MKKEATRPAAKNFLQQQARWKNRVADAGSVVPTRLQPGGCRQRIRELADGKTRILLLDADGKPRRYTIAELLPASFTLG